jgi:UbiD family decarboxylase
MCLAFGAASLDDVGRRLGDVLEMQPPQGLVQKVKGLAKLKSIADSMPKSVRGGPAQEIVFEGDDVDLGRLPVQTCWPGDAAPFITVPAVITKDPRDGTAKSACTGCRSWAFARPPCTGRSTRTAGWITSQRTDASRSRSRSASTRSTEGRRDGRI